jgi:hypothetical protein
LDWGLGTLFVLAILLVGAAVASATAPLKGRAYVGADNHHVHFTISANGTSLSDFGGEFSNPPCAMNAMPPAPQSGRIAHGRFTLTAHHGLLTETVRGSFRAHGRAVGTFSATIASAPGLGGCHEKFSWSAKALPATSQLCANHTVPPHIHEMGPVGAEAYEINITATRVTCKKVYRALDAGNFQPHSADALTGVGAFKTAGWKCSEPSSDNYKCSRAKPKASFTFQQSGQPCGYPGVSPGSQCAKTAALGRHPHAPAG